MKRASLSMFWVWRNLAPGPPVFSVPGLSVRTILSLASLSEKKEYRDLIQTGRDREALDPPIDILGEKEHWKVVRLNYFLCSSKLCFGSEPEGSSGLSGERTELLHEVLGLR